MPEQSLKDKTVKGTFWTATESVLRYGVSFVVGIVLARLLSPDEYGLIGILTVFISFFNVIVDGGFTNAIIRKQDAKEEDYNTVFYINLGVSVFLGITLFACAPLIARFFERFELVPLTQVMSSAVVINALCIVQRAKLTKAINFKSLTKVSVIASVLSGAIGIGMALLDFGVWALVGQQLSSLLINTILLWTQTRWLPKLQFSVQSFRDLWSFGWKLLVSGILNSLSVELTQIVVGKFYNPATLGKYTRARQFTDIFSGNVTAIVQKVSFPVLSTIQDDKVRLKNAYRSVIKVTCLPTFVLMMALAATAKPLILVLLGEKWVECAGYLQIICFSAMMYPLHSLNLNAIQVMGRSDLTLKLKIIKTILGFIPITIGIFFNIYWMLIASVIDNWFAYYLNTYYSKSLLDYSILQQLKDLVPSISISLAIGIPVFALSFIPLNCYILLTIQIVVGVIWGLYLLEKTKTEEYLEIRSIVWKKNKK